MKIVKSTELKKHLSELFQLFVWRVGCYYGTQLYFDLGDRLSQPYSDGSPGIIGSANVTFSSNYWVLFHEHRVITDSLKIDRGIAETTVGKIASGSKLIEIADLKEKGLLRVTLDCHMHVDVYYRGEVVPLDNEPILIALPNGRYLEYDRDIGFCTDDCQNQTRARAYAAWKRNGA